MNIGREAGSTCVTYLRGSEWKFVPHLSAPQLDVYPQDRTCKSRYAPQFGIVVPAVGQVCAPSDANLVLCACISLVRLSELKPSRDPTESGFALEGEGFVQG